MILGNANWYSQGSMGLPKTDAALLLRGTLDGKFEAIQCKKSNINHCQKAFTELQNKGIRSVPYVLFLGQRRSRISYTSSESFKWNGIYDKHTQVMDLIGQFIMSERSAFKTEGASLDLKKAGLNVKEMLSKTYEFWVVGITQDFYVQYTYRRSNCLNDMIKYWNSYNKRYGSRPWVAGGLFIGEYQAGKLTTESRGTREFRMIKEIKAKSYRHKAIIYGWMTRTWNGYMPACLYESSKVKSSKARRWAVSF
jgi:hypothetical protein